MRLRPYKSGAGSFDAHHAAAAAAAGEPAAYAGHGARDGDAGQSRRCGATLDDFIAAGFHSVGFSPMLASPRGQGEMQPDDLEVMLAEMIDCGQEFERQVSAGERYPFANMVNALREIDRGTHRPYPCGAGAGYLGVSPTAILPPAIASSATTTARWARSLTASIAAGRRDWLAERHVHRQEPCQSCWARYLCGGGCHHEVIRRGRPACDYIRGWLHYCLGAYLRLSQSGAAEQRAAR